MTRLPPHFPAAPWDVVPEPFKRADRNAIDALHDRLRAELAAPRTPSLALAFLETQQLPTGRLLFYPASEQARAAVELFARAPGASVIGFLDRRAETLGEFADHPVYPPEHAASLTFDYVIVLQHIRESYFVAQLEKFGVDRAKIMTIYDKPAFRSFAQARWTIADLLPDGLRRTTRNVIVLCHQQTIIEQERLAEIYDPAETLILYVGNPTSSLRQDIFPALQVDVSFDRLESLLDAIRPERIYLATLIAEHYYFLLVRRMAPDAEIIHEIYDWAILFPDHHIADLHAASPARIEASRVGEWCSVHEADAVVTKRMGICWDVVLREFDRPYVQFFQGAKEPRHVSHAPQEAGLLRIVYAGPIPPPAQAADWPFYNYVPLLEEMASWAELHFEVFNSFHQAAAQDPDFEPCLRSMGFERGRYHRAVANQELVDRISSFDYGWMCLNRTEDANADTPTVISARVTGYISAGIPVVLDATWTAAAELVTRFNAGFVIENPTPALVREALRTVDPQQHRQGAARLRDHMLETNDNAIRRLRAVHRSRAPRYAGN